MAEMRKATAPAPQPQYEAIVIGAGVCGIYMLHQLLELGVRAALLETADGPGGTWYWNRYPGARFDSESYTYGYSFSKKLLEDWNWSEHFAAQPETLKYLEHVVDELGLREHMRFGCRVEAATFDEDARAWTVELDGGETMTTRLLLTAIGMLSAATMPRIEGIESFEGESFHTYYAPEGVQVDRKRVAVIGTGATGVQVIAELADKVEELTVFQRRPNWCAPLHNGPIDEEEMANIKASYDEIFARCRETPGSFIHGPDRREFFELSKQERREFWEALYQSRGFGKWLGNFREVFMDPRANAEYSEFMAEKIRERVHDSVTAEKLIPKDHGFGTRRVPLETHYYEAYNRDNVHLVDVNETPIERVTPKGIKTSEREYEFDVIIYATGFDAITGAFDRIDITGENGEKLRQKWRDGPETYLGLGSHGFPNFLILAGPQSGSVASNFPRGIEEAVDWAIGLIRFFREHGYSRMDVEADAEKAWVEHVKSFYEGNMIAETKSWFTGYNSNVAGHDTLRYMVYFGGAPTYRTRLADVADHDYEGFEFS